MNAILCAAAALALCQLPADAAPPEHWFDDLTRTTHIEPETLADLAERAWFALRDDNAAAFTNASEHPTDGDAPALVTLSVSDGRETATFTFGGGETWTDAAAQAVERMRAEYDDPGAIRWLRLDGAVQVGPPERRPARPFAFFAGAPRGLAFDVAGGVVLPPGLIDGAGLISAEGSVDPDRVLDVIDDAEAAAALAEALKSREAVYRRFRTEGAAVIDGEVFPLLNGHRTYDDLSPEELLHAAKLAGDYLAGAVKPDGMFVYIAYPADPPPDEYNIVRHAGSTYALFQLHRVSPDADVRAAADRALETLLTFAQPWTDDRDGAYGIVGLDGQVKLGTNALAILAIAEQVRATGDRSNLPLARQLAQWIVDHQAEDGEFTSYKANYRTRRISTRRLPYFAEEAMFALARLFQVDDDPRWRDAVVRAAKWAINVRDADKAADEIPSDHWLLYALNELQKIAPDPAWARHERLLVHAASRGQRLGSENREWRGGFYSPPRSTPAACRIEGMTAACELFRRIGDRDAARAALQTCREATEFMLQMQLRPEQTMFMDDPYRLLGGLRGGLSDFEVRNDYVQHAISALLGMYREEIAAQ